MICDWGIMIRPPGQSHDPTLQDLEKTFRFDSSKSKCIIFKRYRWRQGLFWRKLPQSYFRKKTREALEDIQVVDGVASDLPLSSVRAILAISLKRPYNAIVRPRLNTWQSYAEEGQT